MESKPHRFERIVNSAMKSPKPGFVNNRTWLEAVRFAIAKDYPTYLDYCRQLSEIAKDTDIEPQRHDIPVHE